ncbi:MAG: spore cortex biosynthesis protein YabQ, partial [Thermacetogeniaceae bacterium]
MSGVVEQFILLILNLLIGGGLGVLFDFYRFLRLRARPGWFWTQVTDLLFWIVSAALVFGIYFSLTEGEARLLMILVIPVGMGAYLKLLSPRVRGWLYGLFVLLGRCLR